MVPGPQHRALPWRRRSTVGSRVSSAPAARFLAAEHDWRRVRRKLVVDFRPSTTKGPTATTSLPKKSGLHLDLTAAAAQDGNSTNGEEDAEFLLRSRRSRIGRLVGLDLLLLFALRIPRFASQNKRPPWVAPVIGVFLMLREFTYLLKCNNGKEAVNNTVLFRQALQQALRC